MTLNHYKTILNYCMGKGQIKPDPERLKVLLDLPLPNNKKALQKALGLFAYYAKWIPDFFGFNTKFEKY